MAQLNSKLPHSPLWAKLSTAQSGGWLGKNRVLASLALAHFLKQSFVQYEAESGKEGKVPRVLDLSGKPLKCFGRIFLPLN